MTTTLKTFARTELLQLNVYLAKDAGEYDDANGVCDRANGKGVATYAPDYDGTTHGGDASRGWNVVILRADLNAWRAAAEECGAEIEEVDGEVEDGHYGDGNWRGVDVVTVPGSTDRVLWIDLEDGAQAIKGLVEKAGEVREGEEGFGTVKVRFAGATKDATLSLLQRTDTGEWEIDEGDGAGNAWKGISLSDGAARALARRVEEILAQREAK